MLFGFSRTYASQCVWLCLISYVSNSMKKFQKFYTCFLQKGIILLSCLGTNISPTPVVDFDCEFSLFLKYYSFIYLFFFNEPEVLYLCFKNSYFILVVKIINMEFFYNFHLFFMRPYLFLMDSLRYNWPQNGTHLNTQTDKFRHLFTYETVSTIHPSCIFSCVIW